MASRERERDRGRDRDRITKEIEEDPRPKGRGTRPSLDDDDAIDVGLFASGPAHVEESIFTEYDYGGNVTRNPPIVWLLTLSRGEGKNKEQYEQPYTIGKGWKLDKKTGEISGQPGLPKTCNAIIYLIKPLKKALAKAGIDASPLADGDARVLEGMDVEVERIEQIERNIQGKGRDRDRADREDRGPKTILIVSEVVSAPWEKGGKSRPRAKEDERPPRRGREPEPEPEPDNGNGDTLTDDAIEALVAVVEKGKVKIGEPLEEALEKYLKGVKGAGDIIDLATSEKFLKSEKGWSYNGKVVDAP